MKNADIFCPIINVVQTRVILAAAIILSCCNTAVCSVHSSNVDSPQNSSQIITIAYLGTTFTIYLPRYAGKTRQTTKERTAIPAPEGLETILLVEDELAILNMASMILSKLGYAVLSANTPSEAIRLVKESAGGISLLITDVIMPEMNGNDLANNLHLLNPQLKCLFMSGYTVDAIAQHGVLDEGVNFIQKPFSLPALATKVRKVLDSKSETT